MTEASTLRVRLKEGKVEIGTPTVQEYLEKPPERTPAAAGGTTPAPAPAPKK